MCRPTFALECISPLHLISPAATGFGGGAEAQHQRHRDPPQWCRGRVGVSGSVSGGVFPLCHLCLEALRQLEERIQANRKAFLAAHKEWPMTQDVQQKVFSVHHVLAILPLRVICAWVFASHFVSYPLSISSQMPPRLRTLDVSDRARCFTTSIH